MSADKEPLCLIIIGVAGTGKSYLINAIRNILQSRCAVTVTTGKASYNIRGVTVLSLLKLAVGPRRNKDLAGQSLNRLLRKQKVMLRDPSGTMKLILWGKYVDLLVVNETYKLENLKLKVYNEQRYLNTPKDEQFICSETDQFQQQLPEPGQVIDTPSITGVVSGIKDITNMRACTSCGKKVIPYQSSETLGQCEGCNLIQILASCDVHWSLRLLLKASDGSKRVISVYNKQLLQLLNVLVVNLELNSVTEEQLTVALLQNNTELCISYNPSNNKMLDVQIA